MKHWVGHIRSTGYTTYGALNILHMEHWVSHIWSTRYTTYEALGAQWGWFYKSGSYFALFEDSLILMGLSAKNKKPHRFRIGTTIPPWTVLRYPSLWKRGGWGWRVGARKTLYTRISGNRNMWWLPFGSITQRFQVYMQKPPHLYLAQHANAPSSLRQQ